MNKIRTWFSKAKKEMKMTQPLTLGRSLQACEDVTVIMEILSSRQRDLDRSLTVQTNTRTDPDLILTTRLSMLRALLQEQEVCPGLWRSLFQVDQVTGSETPCTCDLMDLSPMGGGATDTGCCDIMVSCSLPSSPQLGGRRLPRSLPASPLLGKRHWRSSPTSPSPPPALSRLLVEAALQRSRDTRPPPHPPQGRQGQGGTDVGGEEEFKNLCGIKLSDTMKSTGASKGGGGEGGGAPLCLDSWRYCQLTTCVCFRCPSAPPYDQLPIQNYTGDLLSLRTDVPRTDVPRTDVPRTDAPLWGVSSCLYPSLGLWVPEDGKNRKNEVKQEVNSAIESRFYDNACDQLQRLCQMIPGVPGELQTDLSFILKVFDSTTCSQRTVPLPESCNFCLDKLIIKHLCRNCDQVFCGRCLSHFDSLLQIHEFSPNAAV